MKVKKVFTFLLLAFVAVSVLLALRKIGLETTGSPSQLATAAADGSITNAVGLETKLVESQYSVIYFHAAHRCITCRNIENFSNEALTPEIEAGAIAWRVADYTSDANAALVKQFEVYASTVVLVEVHAGKVIRWKNLEEVWNHTNNRSEFTEFINQAWSEFKTS